MAWTDPTLAPKGDGEERKCGWACEELGAIQFGEVWPKSLTLAIGSPLTFFLPRPGLTELTSPATENLCSGKLIPSSAERHSSESPLLQATLSPGLQKQTEAERQKILAEWKELRDFLEEQEQLLLAQLEELARDIVKRRDEGTSRRSREIFLLGEKGQQPWSQSLQVRLGYGSENMQFLSPTVQRTSQSGVRALGERVQPCPQLHTESVAQPGMGPGIPGWVTPRPSVLCCKCLSA